MKTDIDAQCERIMTLIDAFEKPYIEAKHAAEDERFAEREKRIDSLIAGK